MNGNRLRVGVIGTGFGAAVHIPGLRHVPEVEVAAVCSARLDRAHAVKVSHRIPEYYDDYRKMFREANLDAVTIAAPPELHHAIAIAAAEEGLHILCERPMARNAAEARDMLRLARDAGVQHAIDYETRFTPARAAVKRLVEQGYLGTLKSVSLTVYRTSWRDRVRHSSTSLDEGERVSGVLGAFGSEYIDALRWWFGDINAVAGAAPRTRLESDDATFSIILQFASGAVGTVHVSSAAPIDVGDEIMLLGSNAMVALQGDGRLYGVRRDEQVISELPLGDDGYGDLPNFPDPRVRPFILLAREWVRGILTGTSSAPTFEDGLKVQEVLDSVHRSQHLQRWIDISGKKWPV